MDEGSRVIGSVVDFVEAVVLHFEEDSLVFGVVLGEG